MPNKNDNRVAVPQDSAFLKCEVCGNGRRVWLSKCTACSDPTRNWYEDRIAFLKDIIKNQEALILTQSGLLNSRYEKERQ